MKALIYTRISEDATGERAGVTRQLEDCVELAARLGAAIVDRFEDDDVSAFNGATRKGFEALLDALKHGRADTVIVWHPDRLYRRTKDLQRLIDVVDTGGIEIRSVNGGDLDLSNSTGKMLARILGSVAEQESEHKGERRRRANLQRAQAGAWRKDQPRVFGYTQAGQPLEPEATAVRRAARDVLAGRSLRSIATEWNQRGMLTPKGQKKGGARWTNTQLRRALCKPAIAGLRTYTDRGTVIERAGTWTPLIDPDTWRGLVAFLSDETRRPATLFERRHLLSGVAVCGVCGHKMYAAAPHGPDRPKIYACRPTKHCSRLAGPLDEAVEAAVLARLADPRIARAITEPDGVDVAGLNARRKALTETRNDLARLLREGILDEPGVRRESAVLTEQIAGINQVLADAAATTPAAAMLKDGPGKLRAHWDAASADMRGKVVDELMTVTVLPTPRGIRGVIKDSGVTYINDDYIDIAPKIG
jgi:DNA invertase Pin-like site-specific DNA recombinase